MRNPLTYLGIVLLFLFVLLLGACSKSPRLAPLPAEGVVLAFGDSITHGTGAAQEESYPAVLATLSNRQVVNAGVPGETTAQGRKRLAGLLDETRPALMILCLGGNDFLRRLDEAQTRENLRAMVGMVRERGIDVVLVAVPRLGFGLQVPGFYAEIASEAGIPLEDEIIEEILSTATLKSDPIHPNAAGYKRMAEALDQLLRKAGAL